MPLAEARALASNAHFAAHEPRADQDALRTLAEWCQLFSPEVALEEADQPESLFLDVTGSGPLFGGEQALAKQVVDEFGRHDYQAQAAIADTVGAAWALACYGNDLPSEADGCHDECDPGGMPGALPGHVFRQDACPPKAVGMPPGTAFEPMIVPPGRQREVLGPLPVEALRLSPAVVQTLHRLDIRRIEQLLALPRAALPSRFGKEVLYRIDQSLGDVAELLTPEPVPEPVEVSWSFEPATDDWQVIEAVCERLLERIMEQLRPRCRGIRRLECSLRVTTGEVPLTVGLLQPSASVPHLMGLVRLHCERLQVGGEVSDLVVRAVDVVPLEFAQGQLFEDEAGEDRWRFFPGLIERLSNRLGEKAVLRPRLLPDAQPEYAYRFEPWLGQNASTRLPKPASPAEERLPRPPWLKCQPMAVPVVSLVPDGPPSQFVWHEQCHVIARSWGPERIETGWWRGQDVRRDYYLVESTAGQRFWLFRAVRDGDWFLHGTFA
jgi:protein ImuB